MLLVPPKNLKSISFLFPFFREGGSPLKKKIPQTTYRAIEETFNELP